MRDELRTMPLADVLACDTEDLMDFLAWLPASKASRSELADRAAAVGMTLGRRDQVMTTDYLRDAVRAMRRQT